MWKVSFLSVLCLLPLVHTQSSTRPHIIFILADDLGWDDVSFHGSDIYTPNIDILAMAGIPLNNYYVQSIGTPTRSAIMTGRHPIHTGMQHGSIQPAEPYGLPLNETLLPQYLKKLGYSTHIVGKWHLGFYNENYLPTRRGFDHHFGYYSGKEDYYNHINNKTFIGTDFRKDMEPVRTDNQSYSTDVYASETERIIRSHNKSEPLFLYLAHQAVHAGNANDPLEAPERYVNRFPNIKDKKRRIFAGMTAALDDSVGRIFKALDESGLFNNSIIVFTTDNGGPANGLDESAACNYPLRGTKYTVWEGGVRGVGIIYSNLLKKTGYVSNHLMHVSDWLPTLYHAAGGSPDIPGIDGFNMWESLSQNEASVRNRLLHNIDPIQNFAALRYGDYKLVQGQISIGGKNDGWYPCTPPSQHVSDRGRRTSVDPNTVGFPILIDCQTPGNVTSPCFPEKAACLFNIAEDPCERNNVADQMFEYVDLLLQILELYRGGAVPPRNKPTDPKADPALHGGFWSPWVD